eukprot:TRINITY_DN125470_c0_g1_i1.p1 TRINITY_DN125470_c0_g1~~TRINITY_DN125470_c0_g1_i1.p1  ORF type:complete len:426 (+),score=139.90 TRINITY_DN125470_c0_g1_i1:73-1350(+)
MTGLPLNNNVERTDEVRRLQEEGCSALCLDCPEGMLFGIDYSAWTVGPKFMGVKLIPPGLHYLYCSASSEDVGVGRTGFFLYMRPKDVAVFRWDHETEELIKLADEDEAARYADGVRHFDFDGNLGPYPLELHAQWQELTRHVTERLLRKIEPVSGAVRSKRAEYDLRGAEKAEAQAIVVTPQFDDGMYEEGGDEGLGASPDQTEQLEQKLRRKRQQEQQRLHQQEKEQLESNIAGSNLFFSQVPRSRKLVGGSAAETTQLHMDRTKQLEQMLAKEYPGAELEILGEMQLAYVAFLLGQNFDGFEQWRAILQLLCSCEAAAATRVDLYAELLRSFFSQLSQAPSDLFNDDLTSGNFMGNCALSLLEICDADGLPLKLRKRCGKLKDLVQEKFGISVDDLALLGEDAPQVVDELVDIHGPNLVEMD